MHWYHGFLLRRVDEGGYKFSQDYMLTTMQKVDVGNNQSLTYQLVFGIW